MPQRGSPALSGELHTGGDKKHWCFAVSGESHTGGHKKHMCVGLSGETHTRGGKTRDLKRAKEGSGSGCGSLSVVSAGAEFTLLDRQCLRCHGALSRNAGATPKSDSEAVLSPLGIR